MEAQADILGNAVAAYSELEELREVARDVDTDEAWDACGAQHKRMLVFTQQLDNKHFRLYFAYMD